MPLAPIHSIGHCFQTGCVALTGLGKKVCTAFVDTAAKICRFVYNVLLPEWIQWRIEHLIYGPHRNWSVDPEMMTKWDQKILVPECWPDAAINLKFALVKAKIEPLYFEHIFVTECGGFFGGDGSYTNEKILADIPEGRYNSPKTLLIRAIRGDSIDKCSLSQIESFKKGILKEDRKHLENCSFVYLNAAERLSLQNHHLPKRLKRLFTTQDIKDHDHVYRIFYGRNY